MQALAFRFFQLNSIVLAAAFVTLLLFYFMQALIQTGESIVQEINVIKIVDTRMPEFNYDPVIEIEPPEPLLPEPEETLPPPTPGISLAGPTISLPRVEIPAPAPPTTSLVPTSNIMVPLVRTTPTYPQRALARGVEGFVELSFTVNEKGDVVDPVILNAFPEGYFERAALQSIKRWRYSPTIEDGQAVPTFDVRQRLVFQLDGANP